MTPSELAQQAAREAGKIIMDAFPKQKRVQIKSDHSPVTETDHASSALITDLIQKHFPDHSILSEEQPDALHATIGDGPTWVIDPVDGTSNFISGLPLFAVMIAFVENREIQMGLIFDPLHDEMFVAVKNEGATLNGNLISVSTRSTTRGAMLFAGRGYKKRDHERHGEIIYALEQQTTYFRRLGTAAIMLSSVAAGRADSVILTGSKPWDVLPGILLIREAGGIVTDYCGRPWTLDSQDIVATNGHIHDELIAITKEQDAAKSVCA